MKGFGEYDFGKEDFAHLHLNVYGKGIEEKPLRWFPVLGMYPEFATLGDQEDIGAMSLLQYIVFMYDIKSPLREKIGEVKLRKVHAMSMAGVDVPASGEYPGGINTILKNQNAEVMRMVFRYCRMHVGSRYAYLVSLQSGLHSAEEKLASGDTRELDSMRKVSQEIERVLMDFSGGDDMSELSDNFLDYVERETLGLKPEELAMSMRAGEDPLPGVDVFGRASSGQTKDERLTAISERHEKRLRERYG